MLFYFEKKVLPVNIREIVDDYELNFNNKQWIIYTNYRKLPNFIVLFNTEDLFHLLGIHKITRGMHARSWVDLVKQASFNLLDFKKHPDFDKVRPRIKNYEFLYEIFYKDKVKVCILDKDLSKNTMNLSVIFYKEQEKRVVIIGLRKSKQGYFKPVTLHESRNNPYKNSRRTNIVKIERKTF